MDKFDYHVINPKGVPVLASSVECRYPPDTELSMMEEGYTIMINDMRLTKQDVKAMLRSKAQRSAREVRRR